MVKVSIAIPTYNRKEKLRRLLMSLHESTFKDMEIIVVDDASTDGTEAMIKEEFQDIIYIRHKKPKLVAKSRNDAIEVSSGEFIFFIDDDNVIEKDTIEKLYNYISTHDDVGVAAPVTCWYSMPDKVMYAGAILSKFMRRTIILYSNANCKDLKDVIIEADIFANSYMIRKEAIKHVGLIPWERIPWNGEDGYLHYKIKKSGYRNITLGSARVYHDIDPREGIGRYNEMRLYYALRSKIIFHKDLDDTLHKFTFYLSIPIYYLYYLQLGLRNKMRLKAFKICSEGLLDGLLCSNKVKYV
ncbi:glycosyltransferase [Acidianus sulfidivorans JP7]|uniref:Glycosyl transferase family 2 n=1 Tax=Acidianus sulfidivorans JP7 TaxID=619593 RepID=A0A2U9IJV5_9CREN|nr:glycosyltransferase family 2 protein [Acidianus sulfidivorans]AWR96246.1 glycosyltransferase [Acidianus sulfidivorans JP7]